MSVKKQWRPVSVGKKPCRPFISELHLAHASQGPQSRLDCAPELDSFLDWTGLPARLDWTLFYTTESLILINLVNEPRDLQVWYNDLRQYIPVRILVPRNEPKVGWTTPTHDPESTATVYRYNFCEFTIKTSTPMPIISALDSSVSSSGFLSQTQKF